jgi:hypothetical protein
VDVEDGQEYEEQEKRERYWEEPLLVIESMVWNSLHFTELELG